MSNELVPFAFEGLKVRVIEDELGNPWFVAKDVCDILGYLNSRKAVASHCKHSVSDGVTIRDAIGRLQQMTIIPESDVYRLVIRSTMPHAERFQAWVTEEVLPAIRKYGAYMTPEMVEQALLNPDTIIKLATELKVERQKRIEAEEVVVKQIEDLDQKNNIIDQQKPKVQAYTKLMNAEGLIQMNSTAKAFGTGRGYARCRPHKASLSNIRVYYFPSLLAI